MAIQKKFYTAEEFERFASLPENADRRFELINGEIYEKMPTEEHGVIVLRIGSRILVFVETRNLGWVGVEIRHRMPGDKENARLPDISFTSDATRTLVKKGSVRQMPDLAVEVFSPDDDYQDLQAKAKYYLQNGSRLVWLVYPRSKTVEICTLTDTGDVKIDTVGIDGELDGGDVLPEFTLPVRDIFPE